MYVGKSFFAISGGLYCPGGGVVYPTLPCTAGYYCRSGAMTATPLEDYYANECPVGYYCPDNSTEPTKCPIGTYSNQTRLQEENDCTPCTPGIVVSVILEKMHRMHPSIITAEFPSDTTGRIPLMTQVMLKLW